LIRISSAGLGQGLLLVPLADGSNFVYVMKWRRYRRKKGRPRFFERVVVPKVNFNSVT
jgi:hypothetical protein